MRLTRHSDDYRLAVHHPGDIDGDDVERYSKFTLLHLDRETLRELRDQADAVLSGEAMVENDAARESRVSP